MWNEVKERVSSVINFFAIVRFVLFVYRGNDKIREQSYWDILRRLIEAEEMGDRRTADLLMGDLNEKGRWILLYPVTDFLLFIMATFCVALVLHIFVVH